MLGHFAGGTSCRKGAEENIGAINRVHPDAVSQQSTACLSASGIHRQDGNSKRISIVNPKTKDQLIRQRRLTGPAGTGDTQHWTLVMTTDGCGAYLADQKFTDGAIFDLSQHACELHPVRRLQAFHGLAGLLRRIKVCPLQHVIDHALKAKMLAVTGRVDSVHPVVVERPDFLINNDAPASSKYPNIWPVTLAQHVDHVGKKFCMPALVRTHRDSLDIFLNRRIDNLGNAAVMAEVNHLRPGGLQESADDIDRSVMAVKKTGRGHEPDAVANIRSSRDSGLTERRWDRTHSHKVHQATNFGF